MMFRVVMYVVIADGLLAALVGKPYLRWLGANLPFPFPQVADHFLGWPEWLLRPGGALQAVVGWWVGR